ncbi:MAG: TonB-dependent receptor plug domain-containing protein [Bacteroidia bacterium]
MKKSAFCCFIFVTIFNLSVLLAQTNSKDTINLNEFVVSANRLFEPKKDITRQIITIKPQQISFVNQQNTADLLFQTGNVFIQKSQQGGGSPIIRGMEANRVLIVIDGIRLNNAIYRSGHLHNVIRIDQQILENTEILFGPGSIVYGTDAMGGVMHFETKKPKLNIKESSLMYRFSSVNNESTFNVNIMQGFKKWGFIINYTGSEFGDLVQGKRRSDAIGDLGLRHVYSIRKDSVDIIQNNSNKHKQIGSAYQQGDLFFKLLFEPNKKYQHVLNFQFSTTGNVPRYDRLSELRSDTPVIAEWYYGPELRTFAAYSFNIHTSNNLFDKARITAGYQYLEESRHSRNFGNNNLNNRNEYIHVATINTDFVKEKSKHKIRYGAELAYNYVNSFAVTKNILTNELRNLDTRYPDGGSNYISAAVYLSNNFNLTENLFINYGVRYNYINLNCEFNDKSFFSFLPDRIKQINHALNGSLGANFTLNKTSRLYANISNAFRAPNVDDISKVFDSRPGSLLIIPNEKLNNEQCITNELGINHQNKKWLIDANVYYTKLFNAIVLAPANVNGKSAIFYDDRLTPIFSNQNVQSAYIVGTVLNASYFVSKTIKINSTYNFTYADILKPSVKPLDHITPAFGRTGILYQKKSVKTELFGMYAGAKKKERYNLDSEDNIRYATPNGLPGWFTLNYRVSWFSKNQNFNVNAAIENIFDTNYRLFASGISAPGRNFILSVRYNLN